MPGCLFCCSIGAIKNTRKARVSSITHVHLLFFRVICEAIEAEDDLGAATGSNLFQTNETALGLQDAKAFPIDNSSLHPCTHKLAQRLFSSMRKSFDVGGLNNTK